jgi:hypothetical protein
MADGTVAVSRGDRHPAFKAGRGKSGIRKVHKASKVSNIYCRLLLHE